MAKKVKGVKLKGVYGKPIVKSGMAIPITAEFLNMAGKTILESVQHEIRRDIARARALKGGKFPAPYGSREPVPIPANEVFVKSFKYNIKGKSTIEIVSTWPTAEAHTKKPTERGVNSSLSTNKSSPPFKMWWLVQPKVKFVPIVTTRGEVIIRTAPQKLKDAWIHPGFVRYTFLERGIRKGREKVKEKMAMEVARMVVEDYRLF